MILTNSVFIILGFILLIKGADYLVSGSASIAKRSGIPAIVIGLTIVAFGTSMPELLINIFSATSGSTDLAVSNVLGSNISNVLLILGIAALITPISVQRNTTLKEIPFSVLAIIVAGVIANDVIIDGGITNIISRIDGIVLLLFFTIFMYYTVSIAKGNTSDMEDVQTYKTPISVLMVLGGLLGLFIGGKLTVDGAIGIAELFGLSERVIGLTIVAIGTSLPELVTAVVAALKKQSDIVIGNVIGSNIFNIFWILGLTAIISPLPFSLSLNIDIMMNILVGFILFASLFIGKRAKIYRYEGIFFILLYISYISSLFFMQ
jgi:cation:H+ antiporter